MMNMSIVWVKADLPKLIRYKITNVISNIGKKNNKNKLILVISIL